MASNREALIFMAMALAAMEMVMDMATVMVMAMAANMVGAIILKTEKASYHHSKKYSAGKGI